MGDDECWLWNRPPTTGGYGQLTFKEDGRVVNRKAHCVALIVHGLEVPKGKTNHIHHSCGTKLCVNPAHLEMVSARAHMLRRHGATEELCSRGHERTEQNTYRCIKDGRPVRVCRTCMRERRKRRYVYRPSKKMVAIVEFLKTSDEPVSASAIASSLGFGCSRGRDGRTMGRGSAIASSLGALRERGLIKAHLSPLNRNPLWSAVT